MLYRAVISGEVVVDDVAVNLISGQELSARTHSQRVLDVLLDRGFVVAPNVEQATAAPGERRTTRKRAAD